MKLFITFELKGFSTWGERYTMFICWLFHLPYTTCGTCRKASENSKSQPSSPEAKTQLTDFSQISKSSAHASGAWRHSHLLVPFSIWDFYFDISEWHILPKHVWTPALMLHLTNPCAKRKILSLTKPKGKIYKTKSLGHYITSVLIISRSVSKDWNSSRASFVEG